MGVALTRSFVGHDTSVAGGMWQLQHYNITALVHTTAVGGILRSLSDAAGLVWCERWIDQHRTRTELNERNRQIEAKAGRLSSTGSSRQTGRQRAVAQHRHKETQREWGQRERRTNSHIISTQTTAADRRFILIRSDDYQLKSQPSSDSDTRYCHQRSHQPRQPSHYIRFSCARLTHSSFDH